MLNLSSESRLKNVTFASKAKQLYKKLKTPIEDIRAYGVKNLINDEIFPINLKTTNFNFVPNLTAHLLAGGYFYAYLSEYYDYHNVKYPKLLAFATVSIKNISNEIIETPLYNYPRVDHLTDLFFWDLMGILVFSSNHVKYFLVRH